MCLKVGSLFYSSVMCVCVCVCVCVSVYAQSRLTPWAIAFQAPLSTEFSRQEYLEWVAISFSRGSSRPRDKPASLVSSALVGRFFITAPPGKPHSSVRQGSNRRVKSEGQLQMSSLCFFSKLLGCSHLSLIFPLSPLQNVIFSELKTWFSCTYERIFVNVFTQFVI